MPNQTISLTSKIKKIMQDKEFKEHCKKCRINNPYFEEELFIAEKIAKLNINDIHVDQDLIYLSKPFTIEQIEKNVVEFYDFLDKLAPTHISLGDIIAKNREYFSTDNHGDPNARSYCSSRRLENGEFQRKIFVNIEGRIGDISNAIHEYCHSLSLSFIECKPLKDKRMTEVPTLIIDAISNYYLSTAMPTLAKNFNENALNAQVLNVLKAREALLDGLIIKAITGEETIDNIIKNYSDLYLNNTNILERCIRRIETHNFSNMYEARYLLPQIIALNILKQFQTNSEETIKEYKQLLINDTEWTLEDTLKNFDLPPKEKLIEDYVTNYQSIINTLIKNRENNKIIEKSIQHKMSSQDRTL